MTADRILQIVRDAGLGEHADAVAALIQPCYRLVATALAPRASGFRREEGVDPTDPDKLALLEAALDAMPLGASRLGGVPDLPPGAAWPARDGVPMEFLAQLRLADLAAARVDARLPATGSLLFFYNSQWGTSDLHADAACCAVLHHDGPDDALVRTAPPRVEWKSEFAEVTQVAPMIHGLAAAGFVPWEVVPGGASPYIQGALDELWQDFHSEHASALAGATAPFHENYVLGYVDEQDHVGAHEHGTADQLLLQLDSEDAADLQFGDCNKLFFLLTKDELAARDFSKVRVYSMLG